VQNGPHTDTRTAGMIALLSSTWSSAPALGTMRYDEAACAAPAKLILLLHVVHNKSIFEIAEPIYLSLSIKSISYLLIYFFNNKLINHTFHLSK